MSVPTISQREVKKWRVIVFGVFTVLLSLVFIVGFNNISLLLAPWTLLGATDSPTWHPAMQRWHEAGAGAMFVFLLSGSLLCLFWRGHTRPLLAQFFLLSIVLLMVAQLPWVGILQAGVFFAALDLMLILGGFLTSTKRPGWKALGIIIGISFLYLGIAALVVPPSNPGSWGLLGGILSVLGGLSSIGLTFYEMRRTATHPTGVPEQ